MKRLAALSLGLILIAGAVVAETHFKALSVTETSQTYPLPRASSTLTLCSVGANEAYYRVFYENDTTGAATTAYALLPAGSATAPYCVSFSRSETQPFQYKAVSIVCDTGETATVHVLAE